MALPESWDAVALALGFKTEAEMLEGLYVTQGLSVSQMVKKLGYAQNSIRFRLKEHGIILRARGGPNSLGKTALKDLSDEALKALKPIDALKLNIHPNTIYKEKVRRGLHIPVCTTPVSALPITSTSSQDADTSNSASQTSPSETLSTLSGIEDDESAETSLSSTTEPMKGS